MPSDSVLEKLFDVVQAYVPMLIGFDMMDENGLVAGNVKNKLMCPSFGWEILITRKYGHMYICWNGSEILFTQPELLRLNRHFYHSSTDKLMN